MQRCVTIQRLRSRLEHVQLCSVTQITQKSKFCIKNNFLYGCPWKNGEFPRQLSHSFIGLVIRILCLFVVHIFERGPHLAGVTFLHVNAWGGVHRLPGVRFIGGIKVQICATNIVLVHFFVEFTFLK